MSRTDPRPLRRADKEQFNAALASKDTTALSWAIINIAVKLAAGGKATLPAPLLVEAFKTIKEGTTQPENEQDLSDLLKQLAESED